MRRISLDGRAMDSRDALHRHLREAFGLEEDYGRNLDALHDLLGGMRDIRVVLRCRQAMLNSLGAYGLQLLSLLNDEAEQRDDFYFSALD